MKNYEEIKKESLDFYSKLEPVTCPALGNDTIVFSNSGFNHILRKNGRTRPEKDQLRRFELLPYVATIISSSTRVVNHRQEKYGDQLIDFWSISGRSGVQNIRVVIRQFSNGKKHFFSVMNEKP